MYVYVVHKADGSLFQASDLNGFFKEAVRMPRRFWGMEFDVAGASQLRVEQQQSITADDVRNMRAAGFQVYGLMDPPPRTEPFPPVRKMT